MATVFDVATALIEKSDGVRMSTVKLQKLCFYTFGWYAHLTGDSLFPEAFYAMRKGPVVGELLSAHAGQPDITVGALSDQLHERDEEPVSLSAYIGEVVDAVLGCYGGFSAWELVELTHTEPVWERAWDARPEFANRAALPHDAIISYFLGRTPHFDEHLALPPSAISFLTADDMVRIEEQTGPYAPFVSALRALKVTA